MCVRIFMQRTHNEYANINKNTNQNSTIPSNINPQATKSMVSWTSQTFILHIHNIQMFCSVQILNIFLHSFLPSIILFRFTFEFFRLSFFILIRLILFIFIISNYFLLALSQRHSPQFNSSDRSGDQLPWFCQLNTQTQTWHNSFKNTRHMPFECDLKLTISQVSTWVSMKMK